MDIQWSLVLFTALTGLGGWLFLCVCLSAFLGKDDRSGFAGSVISLALVIVGGLASVTHLSHPDRMLNALQHPASGIFVEAVLVGLLSIVIIAFMVMVRRGIRGAALKAVSLVGMVLGALMSFMAGESYMMPALAAWNTILLPCGYLGTAAVSGISLYLVLIDAKKAEASLIALMGKVLIGASMLSLVTVAGYGFSAGALAGSDTVLYVVGALIAGGIVPLICGYLIMRKPDRILAASWTAFFAGTVGSVVFRCAMWLLGTGLYGFFGSW